jgi:hypothetical protein
MLGWKKEIERGLEVDEGLKNSAIDKEEEEIREEEKSSSYK